jgi:dephospho-CoA kinase
MLLVGLTGGIGSGKSTVAAGLADRGAAVVDADAISREIVQPGGPAYQPVVARFGPGIVAPDGQIDRPALAAVVFGNPDLLAELNRLTHPVIGQVMAERVLAVADRPVVVLDIPLLTIATRDRFQLHAVVVVDTPEDVAVARLVEQRGFAEADARARVAAQIDRGERRKLGDLVLDNSGDRAALEAEIDRAWAFLLDRAAATHGAGENADGAADQGTARQ